MRFRCGFAMLAIAAALSQPVRADVVDATPQGFSVLDKAQVNATPAKAYDALVHIERWWSAEHSYSGNAANFSLDAHAGGCWCERLADGGSVQHMVVVFADPGKVLRLKGGIGPFQGTAVDGVLTWKLSPAANGGTDLTLEGAFGGYMKGGLANMPAGVDGVLAGQLARLKRYIETGSPDAGAAATH